MADVASARGSSPVWFSLARAAIEIGGGLFCVIQQFNTTRDTVFGLLQAGTETPTKMTPDQLIAFLNFNAGKLNLIAFTVALITQIVFWWAALPDTKKGHQTKFRRFIAVALFILEIASDLQYATSTQTTIGSDLTRIFFLAGWAWVGVALYVICMSYGSTFVFLNGIRVLGNVIEGNPD